MQSTEYRSNKRLSTLNLAGLLLALVLGIAFFVYVPAEELEEAVTRARENPRFGLAGTDTNMLAGAILELEESIIHVSEIYTDAEDQKTIRGALHPISFLRTLPRLEESRREFVKNPTRRNFRAYDKNLRTATANYENDAKAYQSALAKLPRDKTAEDEIFYFIDSTTSLYTLLYNTDRLLENIKLVRKEIMRGDTPTKIQKSPWQDFPSSLRPLSRTDQNTLRSTKSFFESQSIPILMQAVEVPSDCFGKPPQLDFFYLIKKNSFLLPTYARPMFYDISQETPRHFQPIKDAGFEQYWQPDFNFYICPDLTYQTEILTLYKIRGLLDAMEIVPPEGEFTELARTRRDFLKEDPLRRETQLKLFETVSGIVDTHSEDELTKKMGFINARTLLEIRLLERQKTGFLEELVKRGVRINQNLVRLTARLPEPLSIKELFISRSYPSLYFMPFNRSTWLAREPLRFIYSTDRSSYYTDYETLRKTFSEEELQTLMGLTFGLLNR